MDRLLPLLSFLLLAAAVSHATLPAQVYWHSVLPNTAMPSAIRDLLTPVGDEKAGTATSFGKGGVNVNTGKGKPGGTTVGVSPGGVGVNAGHGNTSVGVGKGGVGVNAGHGNTRVGVGKGVGVNVRPKGKPPVIVNVKPGPSPFIYSYAATDTQLHDDPNVALFFLEKDLHPSAKFNLHFTRATSGAAFLPRQEADSIPFSTAKLPAILNQFSVEPNSLQAEAMEKTLKECEEPAVKGEKKHCATSLESMVDFATSSLGTNEVKAASTEVMNKKGPVAAQQYTVLTSGVRRQSAGTELVACHPQPYAYAVFYCHATKKTEAFTVSMAGADGTKVKAVAVCHTDTAAWNPNHVAFKVLKVKPGTEAVCHFLPQDHVVWSLSG